jgi:hypothetical protein
VESLRSGLTSPSLVSASIALKAVAVNVSSLASDVMSKPCCLNHLIFAV